VDVAVAFSVEANSEKSEFLCFFKLGIQSGCRCCIFGGGRNSGKSVPYPNLCIELG